MSNKQQHTLVESERLCGINVNTKARVMLPRLSLAMHKQLVEELAPRFDAVYEQLTRQERSVFDHPAIHAEYSEVQFSTTTLQVGCGVATIHKSRCDFFETLDSTRVLDGRVLLSSRDRHVPLPPAQGRPRVSYSHILRRCTDCARPCTLSPTTTASDSRSARRRSAKEGGSLSFSRGP